MASDVREGPCTTNQVESSRAEVEQKEGGDVNLTVLSALSLIRNGPRRLGSAASDAADKGRLLCSLAFVVGIAPVWATLVDHESVKCLFHPVRVSEFMAQQIKY